MNDTKQEGWETIRFDGMSPTILDEEIATEFALTIVLNGEEFATMVCSPTDLQDLVVGFLASEGIIRFVEEIKDISLDESMGFAYVELYKNLDLMEQDHSKRVIGSCCGKSRQFYFKSDVRTSKTITSNLTLSVQQCYALMQQLQDGSDQFKRTGGVHNAGLATIHELLQVRTDIGRHNALDKIYGHILHNHISVKDKLIVFSGRISSEVLLKISKIGAGILLSKSAPTDLALKLAEDLGITVIGFARGDKMNVYTHPHRILETNV
ncbi:formate dehydrogenase accessory sulfurtransferase FdhD [Ornithinibacillus sp. L9]|uniref:Sulfur carrier protein FdhD n=1 Tax=Ornithinibacillus caprae TaxID=2678566 RepID=A0A6N8FK85_9BACI|nr:formate dehydrogenase accessory sulfurtransferase FdhD [Ornithinibacillus caprae]MUK87708.1 formate dehydrogenase accessory sulfurtransferase FdhD [Ornithinibacillus caprae]